VTLLCCFTLRRLIITSAVLLFTSYAAAIANVSCGRIAFDTWSPFTYNALLLCHLEYVGIGKSPKAINTFRMPKASYNQLVEGFGVAGSFLYRSLPDAESISRMLGLSGTFAIQTDDGAFWMPGRSYDEFMDRLYSFSPPYTQPDGVKSFRAYLDTK